MGKARGEVLRCGFGGEAHPWLLLELRVVLRGVWSAFSGGVSEADAVDDWEDTDSLLPMDPSSGAELGQPPVCDTEEGERRETETEGW